MYEIFLSFQCGVEEKYEVLNLLEFNRYGSLNKLTYSYYSSLPPALVNECLSSFEHQRVKSSSSAKEL